jgi:hypothetical protein
MDQDRDEDDRMSLDEAHRAPWFAMCFESGGMISG